YELFQPASMTVLLGQPLTISCKVSYSVTNKYKDSLKNKFSLSVDSSSNTVFLKGQNLQAEDSAVYYCAYPHSDTNQHKSFTKTNLLGYAVHKMGAEEPSVRLAFSKSPSVSLLSGPIGTTQYLMCMIEDFTPNKVTVTWKKNDMEMEGQTPTVGLQPSGTYSASSLLKVNKTEWNNKVKYSCVVQHQGQPTIKTISKTGLYIGEDSTTNNVMFTYSIYII
uniref:Ig-like domain-containing protein n=1 Tax=Oncorhynchus tshawytscha TaxID=74940 RepID=A0AAZ3R7R1_ONCTS